MPRSSGGGSHSGGSHSSSHSHSHSGSSHRSGRSGVTRPMTMTSPRIGYSRYAYYRNDGIDYQYVKDKPNGFSFIYLMIVIIFALQFLFAGVTMLSASVSYVTKIDDASYDSVIRLEDNIDVMTDFDEISLSNTLSDFKTKTGITCSVITIHNSDWVDNYTSLENYAYDLYVNYWSDEKHWLFVYSEQEEVSDFNDWSWEGMLGFDTENILTDAVLEPFNDNLHKYLLQMDVSVAGAFDKAIQELTDTVRVDCFSFDTGPLIGSVIWLLLVILIFTGMIVSNVSANKKEKQELKTLHETGIPVSETPLEDTCSYCGGLFIHGVHTFCPHCAAPLHPMSS